jgi:hypothetical protein
MNPVPSADALKLLEVAIVDSSKKTVKLVPPVGAFDIQAFTEVARLLTDAGAYRDVKNSWHQFEIDPAPIVAELIARAKSPSVEPEPERKSTRHFKGVEIALETFEIHAKYDGEWKSVSESGLEKSSVFKAGGVWRVRVGQTTSAQKHAQRAGAALELLKLADCLDDVTDLEIAWGDGVGSELIVLSLEQPIESQEPVIEVAEPETDLGAALELEDAIEEVASGTEPQTEDPAPQKEPQEIVIQLLRDGDDRLELVVAGKPLGLLMFANGTWNSLLPDSDSGVFSHQTPSVDFAIALFLIRNLASEKFIRGQPIDLKFISHNGILIRGELRQTGKFTVLGELQNSSLDEALFGFKREYTEQTQAPEATPEKARRTRKPRATQTEVSEPVQEVAKVLPPTTDVGLEEIDSALADLATLEAADRALPATKALLNDVEDWLDSKQIEREGTWENFADSLLDDAKVEAIKQQFDQQQPAPARMEFLAEATVTYGDEATKVLFEDFKVLPPEILAMLKLEETLKDLDIQARERVLDWAFAKLVKHVFAT